jgi:predicted CoA-substrate-specific enzyme activase
MKFTVGIDCGSRTIKLLLFNLETNSIIDYNIIESGLFPDQLIKKELDALFSNNNLSFENIHAIYSTGYGRNNIGLNFTSKSEIICHAKGVHYLLPCTNSIIDIGGQDSKIINIDQKGKVLDFVMNDKCAAGTGRFLEKVANILNCRLDQLSELASQHDKNISISSTCVVFAESEIIGLLSTGEKPENIIYAVYNTIAHRIKSQAGSLSLNGPLAFVGGVANHHIMLSLLKKIFCLEIISPQNPSLTGALGAAILASEN